MSTTSSPAPNAKKPEESSRRLWALLTVAVVLTILCLLATLGFLENALGSYHGSHVGQGVCAVIFAVLSVVAMRWAVHVEHRLRGHQPVARSFHQSHGHSGHVSRAATQSRRTPKLRSGSRLARKRKYGPVSLTVLVMITFALAIVMVVLTFSTYHNQQRSGETQSHGIAVTGTVDSVDNTQHCGRSSCSWTAAITVTLNRPVKGLATTTVHYPAYSYLFTSDSVSVLVDPEQPSYAEIPGVKFEDSGTWLISLGLAILFGLFAFGEARALTVLLIHRRNQRADAGTVGPTKTVT
jgi:hypothetical protein